MAKTRLDKLIASQLNISRREARAGIQKGKATVNGEVAKSADYILNTEVDEVTFAGQAISYKEFIYIVMNKPRGVLSASEDKKRETVIDLVPDNLKRKGLFPVGRLDKDTTGLLIITDDGDFAHQVLSPQKNVYKSYIAEVDSDITQETLNLFSKPIILADGTVCRRAYLKRIDSRVAEIKICEGKYHQIKRMLGIAGLGVNALKRVGIGDYYLPVNLSEGECVEVQKVQLKGVFASKTLSVDAF